MVWSTSRGNGAALVAQDTGSQTPTPSLAPRQSAHVRPSQASYSSPGGRQPVREAGSCETQARFGQWGPRTRPLLPGTVTGRMWRPWMESGSGVASQAGPRQLTGKAAPTTKVPSRMAVVPSSGPRPQQNWPDLIILD